MNQVILVEIQPSIIIIFFQPSEHVKYSRHLSVFTLTNISFKAISNLYAKMWGGFFLDTSFKLCKNLKDAQGVDT